MRLLRRALNLGRKIAAGLTPFGENISPEVPNDLYVAHLSIYAFAAPYARGKRVLDLGSGAGYGSRYLLDAGATHVTGIDLDPRNVRYASRRYAHPSLRFLRGDAQHLDTNMLGTFDLIVASNVLEHLTDVRPALDAAKAMLNRGGTLIIAVPPIVDEASMRANEAIPYHRSNLMISRWLELLRERFADVTPFRHDTKHGVQPDFGDPFPSRLSTEDFIFEEVEALAEKPTITALFVAVCSPGR
jgi:SAM-dependent methyltransferase